MNTSTPAFCLLLLCLLPATVSARPVVLVRRGKAQAAIVIAPDASAPVRHGAEEIRNHLQLMSGAALAIDTSPLAGSSGTPSLTRVTHLPAAIVIREDPALGSEEFTIRTSPGRVIIDGGRPRGVLYGCYALLEEVLGVRWFTPRVTYVPKQATVQVANLNLHEKPAFEYREPYYNEALDRDWAARNRTDGNFQHLDATVGGGVKYGPFVHTFNELVPPDVYYDKHPEYFSMINGKRMKGYYQLCLTNPDVLKIVIAKVEDWIKQYPDATIFSVSQNDTGYNCQCDNCREVEREEGAPSGVVLRFVNAVADAIAKDHPHVLIDTLAYQWSETPPKLTKPRPNVRIRLAPIGACVSHGIDVCSGNTHPYSNLQAWAKITNQLYIWHYSTNFANYLQPLPDLDEIAHDIPLFHRNGVVGLFYEGDYAPGGGGEMDDLKAYLMAKLMWNPDRPAGPIIDEFLTGVYGKAAPEIKQWLDLLHAPERTQNVHAHIYDPPTASYLSPELLAQGNSLFDRAEAAVADDPTALDEVQRARLAIQYTELMQALKAHPAGGNAAADPTVEQLRRTVAEKIRKYGIGQVREGQPVAQYLQQIGATGG